MNVIFTGLVGSHLYHLNTPESDRDYKSIYIPEYRDIILGRAKKNITTSTGQNDSKNSANDIDNETFSLQEFVKLACQGQPVAIDLLHCTNNDTQHPVWQYLVDNRTKFYSSNMDAFMGYVKRQSAKYSIKGSKLAVLEDILEICDDHLPSNKPLSYIRRYLPQSEYTHWESKDAGTNNFYVVNGSMMHDVIPLQEFRDRIQKQYNNYGERAIQAKNNGGNDWKAISHSLRVGYQLMDIFQYGDFEYPLKQTQLLLDVKQGKLDYATQVGPMLEGLINVLDNMSRDSDLSCKVDTDFWDYFVFKVYTGKFKYI